MNAAKLLDRLERVKQTAPGRWIAACPAHQDRSPSLSIRELDDGRLLIHCFGGCETQSILEAAGLRFSDLFPAPLPGTGPAGGFAPSHSRIPARDLLMLIDYEITVAANIMARAVDHRAVEEAEWQRLAKAARRIHRARYHAEG